MKKKKVVKSTVKGMSKNTIFKTLAEKLEVKPSVAKQFVTEFIGLAYVECKNPKGFMIPGLGKLMLKDRPARMGRNPRTGETIKIKAKTVLKFRIAKAAKVAILGATPKKPKAKVVKKVRR